MVVEVGLCIILHIYNRFDVSIPWCTLSCQVIYYALIIPWQFHPHQLWPPDCCLARNPPNTLLLCHANWSRSAINKLELIKLTSSSQQWIVTAQRQLPNWTFVPLLSFFEQVKKSCSKFLFVVTRLQGRDHESSTRQRPFLWQNYYWIKSVGFRQDYSRYVDEYIATESSMWGL